MSGSSPSDSSAIASCSKKAALFFAAAEAGDAKTLASLAAENPDLGKAKDKNGWSALWLAVSWGHADCVKALLPWADFVEKNERRNGDTALMMAAERGAYDCVEILAPVSDAKAANAHGKTALMLAAQASSPLCLGFLLPGSDPSAKDSWGNAALALAARAGHFRSVLLLLPSGNAGALNNDGMSAIGIAMEHKHWDCADALAASLSPKKAKAIRDWAPEHVPMPRCEAVIERAQLAEAADFAQSRAEAQNPEEEARARKNTARRI